MNRKKAELYPNYSAFIEEIRENGMTDALLNKIIQKHQNNAAYNRRLYNRYRTLSPDVPIFSRTPRFAAEDGGESINNKVNNDFFSEIVDVKVGYFAGRPIGYSYSPSKESGEDTGGINAAEEARRTLTGFVVRNNMYDMDMEITKFAAICGYAGRLMYIDGEGEERIMATAPYETIILYETEISEPTYGIRYYEREDTDGNTFYVAEFYDERNVTYYKGDIGSMELDATKSAKPHLFDHCPLQGIANNKEMLGDAEKVQELIDAYDRTVSDNSNSIEAFANAYLIFENVNIDDEEIRRGQKAGSFKFFNGTGDGKIYYLTKSGDGALSESHLNRLEDNIYRFSKTPNLGDQAFGTASGVSLKFKITGLETKCGMFQAKMQSAGTYMFKVLASSFRKKRINFEPLRCVMTFKRNFPLDLMSEAQSATALIGAGLPKRMAFGELSFIDDIEEVMRLIEEEQDGIPDLDFEEPDEEPEEIEEEEEHA